MVPNIVITIKQVMAKDRDRKTVTGIGCQKLSTIAKGECKMVWVMSIQT